MAASSPHSDSQKATDQDAEPDSSTGEVREAHEILQQPANAHEDANIAAHGKADAAESCTHLGSTDSVEDRISQNEDPANINRGKDEFPTDPQRSSSLQSASQSSEPASHGSELALHSCEPQEPSSKPQGLNSEAQADSSEQPQDPVSTTCSAAGEPAEAARAPEESLATLSVSEEQEREVAEKSTCSDPLQLFACQHASQQSERPKPGLSGERTHEACKEGAGAIPGGGKGHQIEEPESFLEPREDMQLQRTPSAELPVSTLGARTLSGYIEDPGDHRTLSLSGTDHRAAAFRSGQASVAATAAKDGEAEQQGPDRPSSMTASSSARRAQNANKPGTDEIRGPPASLPSSAVSVLGSSLGSQSAVGFELHTVGGSSLEGSSPPQRELQV